MSTKKYEANRFFLKDTIRKQIDFSQTAQSLGKAAPPLQKPCPPAIPQVDLPDGAEALARLAVLSAGEAMIRRSSVRQYKAGSLSPGSSPRFCGLRKASGKSSVARRRCGLFLRPAPATVWKPIWL